MNKSISAIIIALFLATATLWAQEFPHPMNPPRLVNDFTETFTSLQQQELENVLINFDKTTSTQIAVVTVSDLNGYEVSEYAIRLFEKWGIGGNKDKNNGVLILLKPKTNRGKGEVFICVGYGLEGVIPDAIAKRIVEKEMIPYFKNGDYYRGVESAVQTIISLSKGEFTAEEYNDNNDTGGILGGLIFMIIAFVLITVFSKNGGNRGGGFSGSSKGFGVPPIFMGGGHSGGSSGFGGFGGGFSGGGGAGGSW